MPCCCPPRTTTEPMSTLTRKFLTAASEPVISSPQAPPSRVTCVSCAHTSDTGRASATASPAVCSERFNPGSSISRDRLREHPDFDSSFLGRYRTLFRLLLSRSFLSRSFLVNLGQLRQHSPRLRPAVLALIFCRQRHQHPTHAAVSFHCLQHSQGLGTQARVRIVYQRLQQCVPDARVILYIAAQRIQSLEAHSRIRVVLQCVEQCFPYL